MKWTRITAKNFLSLQEVQWDLDSRGLVLIEGNNKSNEAYKSNGSGKTALLDTIIYALYDTTTKGLKADDVVNNKTGGKNTEVILEGEKNGHTYRIERYRKHKKNKNKVLLFADGEEITEKSVKDTNARIEEIVGIDFNTFINSIMFSQGSGAGRFAVATDKEKKEILENLVNLSIYAEAQAVAKERVKKVEDRANTLSQGIEKLKWSLDNLDQLEEQDRANYEDTKRQITAQQEAVKQLTDEMHDYSAEHFPMVEQAREAVETLKADMSNIGGIDLSPYLTELNRLNQEIQSLEHLHNQVTYKKQELLKQYKSIRDEDYCPVCGEMFKPERKQAELDGIREQLKPLMVKLSETETDLNELGPQRDQANQIYQQQKEKYDNLSSNWSHLQNQLEESQRVIQTYEGALVKYKNDIDAVMRNLEWLRERPEPKPRTKERQDIEKGIKDRQEQILDLEKEKLNLENMVKLYSNTGVKSHVLDLITPFLNERANRYLGKLAGSDIEVVFSTQKQNKDKSLTDKFDIQVVNSTGGETYQANSEGEKKRIDLAISLAIQDLVMSKGNISTNIVFYDEVFDALDEVGSENVITLLRERLDLVPSIFVITHSDHLKNLFETTITVTKDKQGISTVEGAGTS